MRSVTKLIFSVLALLFTIWIASVAYKILKGQWNSGTIELSMLVIVFMVLSCTYFLASAIQKGAETISNNHVENNKVLLYESALELFVSLINVSQDELDDRLNAGLEVYKARMALYANFKVLSEFNKLCDLFSSKASSEVIKKTMTTLIVNMRSDMAKSNINMNTQLSRLID